jgi:flagellar basal-body rod protein FlgB
VLFDTTQIALERAIQGAGQRHSALAANLANAETPGYQRKDVDFHGTLSAAMAGGREAVERTAFATAADPTATAKRADGNTVDAESEAAQLAVNSLDHQTAVQVARSRIDMLRVAMGVQ